MNQSLDTAPSNEATWHPIQDLHATCVEGAGHFVHGVADVIHISFKKDDGCKQVT